jgi:hypothetical protein
MRRLQLFMPLLITLSLLLPADAFGVELGPFDVTVDLCKNVQFVGGVVNAWANATFPVTGEPGFVVMMIENTNPIITLCDFIIQLQVSDTTSAIFLTADKLNTLTDQKWNDHLNLVKQTYTIANSVYDFNSGQKRQGTVDATSMAADLGNWQRMVTEFSTGSNPEAVRRRQTYDNQVQELANIAHTRAILKEGTTCPQPDASAPDYNNIVNTQIIPLQQTVQSTETQLNFIRYQLIELGPRFLSNIEEVQKYYDDVQNVFALGVTTKVTESSRNAATVKPTGVSNADGTAVRKKQNISQTIQTFTAINNSQIYTDFRTKYEKRYTQWAAQYWKEHSDTEGGRQSLQQIFKPAVYECNETTLMAGYTKLQADDYEHKRMELYKRCEASNQMDQKRVTGLMATYMDNLRTVLFSNKTAQNQVWTLESKYLGRQRSVSLDQTGNYFQESVVCAQSPEMIDLEVIQAKQAEVNASYNEIIARETVKNAMVRDEEIKRQNQLAQDQRMKRQQIEKDHQSERNATSAPTAADLSGAF